jgi:hypothetical protein
VDSGISLPSLEQKTQEKTENTEVCITMYLITYITFKVMLKVNEDKFGGPAAPLKLTPVPTKL